MGIVKLDIKHSIGTVTQAEYDKEREHRLKPDEIAESSDYKLRLTLAGKAAGKFAIDFMCQVRTIDDSVDDIACEVGIDILDLDNRPVKTSPPITVALAFEGLLLVVKEDGNAVKGTETGYFLSALDDIDAGLAALDNSLAIPLEYSRTNAVLV